MSAKSSPFLGSEALFSIHEDTGGGVHRVFTGSADGAFYAKTVRNS